MIDEFHLNSRARTYTCRKQKPLKQLGCALGCALARTPPAVPLPLSVLPPASLPPYFLLTPSSLPGFYPCSIPALLWSPSLTFQLCSYALKEKKLRAVARSHKRSIREENLREAKCHF